MLTKKKVKNAERKKEFFISEIRNILPFSDNSNN